MSKINNSNYNKISVKTDSMVKMIEQLSKLGVFKEKRKSRAKKTTMPVDEIRQDNDMVGYVKTLAGQAGRGDPNLFSLRQVEPGMSQQQIRDITERNAAGVAALRAEVQQQRLADIEAQQGQRFADISMITGIDNPVLSRFRGAQQPGAGQRASPFIQSTTIEDLEPDIQEGGEAFTQSLNEGGPKEAPIQTQTELFAEGEEEELISTRPQLQPREKVGGGGGIFEEEEEEFVLPRRPQLQQPDMFGGASAISRSSSGISRQGLQRTSSTLGLGKIPRRNAKIEEIKDYYIRLTDVTGDPEVDYDKKEDFFEEIENILSRTGFKYSD
jgi:hypothetical protein